MAKSRKEWDARYEAKRGQRSRNWTFVAYPDSVPEDWREKLDDEHLQWIESPLHDSDVNADGTPKKPHWHVMVIFSSVKTYAQAKEIADLTNGTVPQVVKDKRAMVRYFVHMDNPEKTQYNVSDLIAHGGADILGDLQSASDRYIMIAEMMDFVDQGGVTEFFELMQYARTCRKNDWFPLLCDSCSYVMTQYIKSRRCAAKNAREATFEAKKQHRDATLSPRKSGGLPKRPKKK